LRFITDYFRTTTDGTVTLGVNLNLVGGARDIEVMNQEALEPS
jgi:hypothetical protein